MHTNKRTFKHDRLEMTFMTCHVASRWKTNLTKNKAFGNNNFGACSPQANEKPYNVHYPFQVLKHVDEPRYDERSNSIHTKYITQWLGVQIHFIIFFKAFIIYSTYLFPVNRYHKHIQGIARRKTEKKSNKMITA